MLAAALSVSPAGLGEVLALVDGLDDALTHGLARVDEERAEALESLAAAFVGSPLAERVGDAVGKIVAGTVTDEHLIALAGARAALLGAAHDALLAGVNSALGRVPEDVVAQVEANPESTVPAAGRSWLRELALIGWRGVDHELAAGSVPILTAAPAHRRLAVLLDGFAAELRALAPIASLERVPVRRWGDLWSRALLLSQETAPVYSTRPIDGRLLILGVDLHEHPTVFRAQVHGLLETSEGVRLVRTSVAAAKVDTITGPSAWRMLAGFPILLGALAEHRVLEVTGMPLTSAGDLIWNEALARPGETADPFAVARVRLGTAVIAAAGPLDRHPAGIAVPVLLEGYSATADAFDLGGYTLAVDLDRLPAAGPLTPALVAASTACIGLLRWDAGRWSVQPLAVQAMVKKKPVAAHTADWALGPTEAKAAKAEAIGATAVEVLRERAGRLLRR
jgi:hypothetical protein